MNAVRCNDPAGGICHECMPPSHYLVRCRICKSRNALMLEKGGTFVCQFGCDTLRW